MQLTLPNSAGPPSRILLVTMAVIMISRVNPIDAQEAFLGAEHEYESTRNPHYEAISDDESRSCILSLPESVMSDHYGSHKRPAVCIARQDVALALDEAHQMLSQVRTSTYADQASRYQQAALQSSELPRAGEIISSAELVAQASRILAHKFRLSEFEILYELPKIDASNSPALAATCPSFLRDNMGCFPDEQTSAHGAKEFRSLSGFCNNLINKSWGSARSAMVRFLPPDYQNSVWAPRAASDGSPLPPARVVSFVLHQDAPECDNRNSMLGVVWGQFINHDINLGVRITDVVERLRSLDCCKVGGQQSGLDVESHCHCLPIEIPKDDPFYGYFRQKCMNFVRLSPALQPGCSMGPVQPMNKHSSFLDGSSIYGSNAATLRRLRTYQGGLLRSQPVPTSVPTTITAEVATSADLQAYGSQTELLVAVPSDYQLANNGGSPLPNQANYLVLGGAPSAGYVQQALFKDLLPANVHAPDVGCERRNRPKELYCFDAGDSRANEQIQLASLHTIMMREHNRLAQALAGVNPHWSDERLFQEARKIVSAEIQHITFNEFLPIVVGKIAIGEFGLELAPSGQFFQGYDPKTNAGVRAEFQAAAFRYGHSLVPGHIDRFNKFHQKIESIRLSKLLKQPFDLYFPGVLDTYIMGLADQRSGRMDASLTTEVANHLFEKPGNFFGMDLAAINIQRAREMGIRGYNSYRKACGLPRASHFDDLMGTFSNKTLFRMSQVYKHVDDIDLFTGGVSEFPAPGALVGPTFSCLIAKQVAILRAGDRFWYENPDQFTIEQLDEIRRQTSARLLCDNADDLEDIQASAMLMPDQRTNPRVSCASLPSIDLAKWRELPTANNRENHHVETSTDAFPQSLGGQGAHPEYSSPTNNKLPALRAPLASPASAGHLILMNQALQNLQKSQPQPVQSTTMKSFSHFVDHVVDTRNYQATN